jgi:hypothetical protein
MNRLTIRNILTVLFFGSLVAAAAPGKKPTETVEGPNVRVLHHDDGSQTRFERSADNQTLQSTMRKGGVIQLRTVYRMDKHTNPISCKIFDGSDTELYRIRYGYRKSDGQLVAEEMYDSRVVRRHPGTGLEMPVRSIRYFYDEKTGKRSAPIVITTQQGKAAEEIFTPNKVKIEPFVPEDNPFKKEQNQGAPGPAPSLKR